MTQKFVEAFRHKAAQPESNVLFFSAMDAIEIIGFAKNQQIDLLGIDGIFLRNGEVQPSLEDSIDYSIGQKISSVHARAVDFIKRHSNSPDLYFELIFSM